VSLNSDKVHKKNTSDFAVNAGLLKTPLPLIDEPEGDTVPKSLPLVIDAHVHLFPDYLFGPIWQWFEKFGWPIRYPLPSADIIKFLLSHGIEHIVLRP